MAQTLTICLNCGAENAEDAKVCEQCGKRRLQQKNISKTVDEMFVNYFDEHMKG